MSVPTWFVVFHLVTVGLLAGINVYGDVLLRRSSRMVDEVLEGWGKTLENNDELLDLLKLSEAGDA